MVSWHIDEWRGVSYFVVITGGTKGKNLNQGTSPPLFPTNSMKQSLSREANSHSASQEIAYLLWNPKVYNCIHVRSPLVPIPSQMNVHFRVPRSTLFVH
jgi:hypothetical protein